MKKITYDYELWKKDEIFSLVLKNDEFGKTFFDKNEENTELLCSFKALNPYQATIIRNRFLRLGEFGKDLQDYEIWVDKSKDRLKETVKILVPTARPRKSFIDMSKFVCIKILQATNDTDGINLCRKEINYPKLSKKLKGLFAKDRIK